MNKKYDTAVVIGRFQPLHNSHLALIARAAKLARNVVIVVGSAYQPRSFKNPWTCKERAKMISHSIDMYAAEYKVMYNIDTIHDDAAWCKRIKDVVGTEGKIVLVGHHKDASSFYLDMFPEWDLLEIDDLEPMNATSIRYAYFGGYLQCVKSLVPNATFEALTLMRNTSSYIEIAKEMAFLDDHKKIYAGLPYAPIFVTADAMVNYHGKVLMIKRKHIPGKGLWALPGGYVNANTDKSIQMAAIRELKEETNIKVSGSNLVQSITAQRTFDTLGRSSRGRIITTCFRIDLASIEIPKVKASDDAAEAKWIPIHELKSEEMFEDHYEIIQAMLNET